MKRNSCFLHIKKTLGNAYLKMSNGQQVLLVWFICTSAKGCPIPMYKFFSAASPPYIYLHTGEASIRSWAQCTLLWETCPETGG
jgi:hypothetical protein